MAAFDIVTMLWGNWLWLAGIAFSIVTVLIAAVYVIGSFLLNDKMKAWAKMELAELFYSAVIISLAVAALPFIDDVVHGAILLAPSANAFGSSGSTTPSPAGSYCGQTVTTVPVPYLASGSIPLVTNGQKNYVCQDICDMSAGASITANSQSVYNGINSCSARLGIWYLREVFDETSSLAFDTYLSYIWSSMAAAFTINFETIFEKTGFITFNPWAGFFTMPNNIKSLSFEWATKILMITKFQEVFLRFIAIALFPAFFVLGAILRTFTFTRKLGGLLLAIALSLYFIYPAFYAFGALVMIQLKDTVRTDWVNNAKANALGAANPDPPIANTMYVLGDIPVIGGKTNSMSAQDAQNALAGYEGYSSITADGSTDQQNYLKQAESGTFSIPKLSPTFDPNAPPPDPNAQPSPQLTGAVNAFNPADQGSWFGKISQQSKEDSWVSFAFEPNGPLDILSRLSFWSMFFSLLSIISTIAAIRSLSITFGGDIEIAGLTRLI